MIQYLLTVVLLLATSAAPPPGADGDRVRTRTLTYDAGTGEWAELPPPSPGTPEGDLHAIRVRIQQKKFWRALRQLKRFIKTHGAEHRLFPETILVRAEAMIGRRDYAKAHDVLQTFLDEFGGMTLTSEALRLELIIAETFLNGVKRKLLGMRLLSGEDLAYKILDMISMDYPDSLLAEAAIKTKADYLFQKGEHALAELEYAQMIKAFPRSRYHRFALRRTADAALASHGGVDYDEAALIEARERYQEYRGRYPGAADREGVGLILSGIREQLAEKEFSVGEYYERTGHLSSALFYYRSVRGDWPESVAATKATQRLELLGALEPVATAVGARRP